MRDLPNIEKSAFRKGEYVGYALGRMWRVTKTNSTYGNWVATPPPVESNRHLANVYAFRLSDMSEKLAALKEVAYLAIQCHANKDQSTPRGTFLFTGDMVPVSPVFPEGCIPCFAWCAANGWIQAPYDSKHPVGVYQKG